MPNVVTPMSIGDAISWEIALFFASVLGLIAAIVLWGMVFIVVGSVIFLIYAIILFAQKKVGLGIACFLGWVFCASIVWSIGGPMVKENRFRSTVMGERRFNFYEKYHQDGLPSRAVIVYITRRGEKIKAGSLEEAVNGDTQPITTQEESMLMVESIKSAIIGRGNQEYPLQEDDFIDFNLSADRKSFEVVFSNKWHGKYQFMTRKNQLNYVYQCYAEAIKGMPEGPLDFIAKMKVYNQNGKILATGETYSGFFILIHMDGQDIMG